METFQFFIWLLFTGKEKESVISDVAGLCECEGKFVGEFKHCDPFYLRVGESLLVDSLSLGSEAEINETSDFQVCLVPGYVVNEWASECDLFALILPVRFTFIVTYVSFSVLCLSFVFYCGFVCWLCGIREVFYVRFLFEEGVHVDGVFGHYGQFECSCPRGPFYWGFHAAFPEEWDAHWGMCYRYSC